MALVCPLAVPQASQGGCVGNFFSSDALHLVSADGYDLVFEQLLPETNQGTLRLPLAANGRIVSLYRVPLAAGSSAEQAETNDAPDMLLIHTQTINVDPEQTPGGSVMNHLHFKKYDSEIQELKSVSTFTCSGGPYHPLSHTWSSLSVCLESGPMAGTVAFASSADQSTHFLDPQNPNGASVFPGADARGISQTGGVINWVTSDLVIVTRKRADQMSYALDFVRVERRAKTAKSSFRMTSIDRASLPPGLLVRGVGTIPGSNGETLVSAILSDDTVNTYACKQTKVELLDEKRLDVPKKDAAVPSQFSLASKSKYRRWVKVPSKRNTESYFLSDDALVLMVESVEKQRIFKVNELPQSAMLSPLGLGVFKLYTTSSSVVQLLRIRTGENPNELSIRYEMLKPRSYEFDNAQLIKHDRSAFFGSSFWFSFKGSMSKYLCKTERALLSRFLSIPSYPFTAPIVGVWWVNECLVISTASETATYELDGLHLRRVVSEFDCQVSTLAIVPGVQVTVDAIRFAGGAAVSLPFATAVSAAIDGSRVIVASTDEVLTVVDGHIVNRVTFDDVIVGVDCRDSVLAVCTASALHIHHGVDEKSVFQLRELATSVGCGPDGHVYVGDVEGDLFVWPEQQYTRVANNPIKSIRTQSIGATVLAGPDGSIYIDEHQNFVRLPLRDASDVILKESNMPFGVVLLNGVLKLLDTDANSTMVPRLIDASELLHSRPEDVKFWGQYVYSFGVAEAQRKLQRAPLSNVQLIQSFDIPSLHQKDISDFQVFMLSETKFLEFGKREPSASMSDSENDDEEDDDGFEDFDTHIVARLYELQPELGKVTVLNEREVDISGDPYEEVVIKFYSPNDFIIFTHSSSAVPGSTEPHNTRALEIGESTSCFDYLYDDHWVPVRSGGVIIVSFSGDVSYVSPQQLRATAPVLDCFRSPANVLGNVTKSGGRDEAVFNVLAIDDLDAESVRLVTTSRRKSGEPMSMVSMVDVTETGLAKSASMRVHDRSLSLVRVTEADDRLADSQKDQRTPRYLEYLLPDAAIGTSRGGVYLWSSINDEALAAALLKVQKALRQSIEVIDDAVITEDENSVDGALLMMALRMPEAEPLFKEAGLDAAELKRTLQVLTY